MQTYAIQRKHTADNSATIVYTGSLDDCRAEMNTLVESDLAAGLRPCGGYALTIDSATLHYWSDTVRYGVMYDVIPYTGTPDAHTVTITESVGEQCVESSRIARAVELTEVNLLSSLEPGYTAEIVHVDCRCNGVVVRSIVSGGDIVTPFTVVLLVNA